MSESSLSHAIMVDLLWKQIVVKLDKLLQVFKNERQSMKFEKNKLQKEHVQTKDNIETKFESTIQ